MIPHHRYYLLQHQHFLFVVNHHHQDYHRHQDYHLHQMLQSLTATLDLLPTNSKLIRGIPEVKLKLNLKFSN